MKSSWRDRPTGSWFSRLWRPWVSLHPLRGRGRTINEPKPVGIRDLMASPDEVQARPVRRWLVIGGFFALLFVGLIVRLFFLQVVDYKASAAIVNQNSLRVTTIPATRGEILDRAGEPLVTNVTTTEIRLSRAEASLHPAIKGSLSSLTGLSVQQINRDLADQQYSQYQPAPIMSNAPQRDVEFIKLHPGEFPGVSILDTSTRAYPDGGSIAAQILGYVGPITSTEIAENPHAGYQTDSTIGKSGIESYYEQYLRGKEGTSTLEVNANEQILGAIKTTEPVVGDSVVLNIDAPLQQTLQNYLSQEILADRHSIDPVSHRVPEALNGAAIVMNPNNGEVYAMASYPSYNLNSFVNGLTDATYKQLNAEGAFNNYAIQGLYTPGSTFKLVTATTELQTGIFPADKLIDDTGTFTVPGCQKGQQHLRLSRRRQRSGRRDRSPDGPHRILGLLLLQPWLSLLVRAGEVRPDPDPERGRRVRARRADQHRSARRSHQPRGLARGAQAAPRRRPDGVPPRHLVHGRQHRDGVRTGLDGAHADRPRQRLRHLRQRRYPLRARSRLRPSSTPTATSSSATRPGSSGT